MYFVSLNLQKKKKSNSSLFLTIYLLKNSGSWMGRVCHSLDFAGGWSYSPTCSSALGISYKLEAGVITPLDFYKSGDQNFLLSPIPAAPKGRGLSSKVQTQPLWTHCPFMLLYFLPSLFHYLKYPPCFSAWKSTTQFSGPNSKVSCRASLVAQWLGVCLLMRGTRVRSLVWEDPACRGATGPVSHNCWACASGACAPQRERPRWWEASAPRWRVAPACRNWGKP